MSPSMYKDVHTEPILFHNVMIACRAGRLKFSASFLYVLSAWFGIQTKP